LNEIVLSDGVNDNPVIKTLSPTLLPEMTFPYHQSGSVA